MFSRRGFFGANLERFEQIKNETQLVIDGTSAAWSIAEVKTLAPSVAGLQRTIALVHQLIKAVQTTAQAEQPQDVVVYSVVHSPLVYSGLQGS